MHNQCIKLIEVPQSREKEKPIYAPYMQILPYNVYVYISKQMYL